MLNAVAGDISERIFVLNQEHPQYRNLLDLFSSLFQVVEDDLETVLLPVFHPPNDKGIEAGFPLFGPGSLPVDRRGAHRLLQTMMARAPRDRYAVIRLDNLFRNDHPFFERVLDSILSNDGNRLAEDAKQANINPALLILLFQMALTPSFREIRRTLAAELERIAWDWGYCPLCGSPPRMARLEKEGQRVLGCGLCGHEWSFPRIKCPYCRADDHDSLYYLFSDEEEGYRIHACEHCRGYIKTVDSREREAHPLELEDLVTLHLDIMAVDRGLTRTPEVNYEPSRLRS